MARRRLGNPHVTVKWPRQSPKHLTTRKNRPPASPRIRARIHAPEYPLSGPSGPPARYVAKLGVDLPGLLVSIRMTAFIT